MYRNQYDTDVITWSPQGRIFQIEYAMEAVKQGTCVVGLRSNKYAVVCTLKRAAGQLACHQQKIFRIDDHCGIAISGLTADARVLSTFMRNECLHHKFVHNSQLPISRLVGSVGSKSQINTQRISKRPFGVGLLVIGYDSTGPHLYETCPSGNYFEYKAMALGGRSQSAKTYLEKHFETFDTTELDDLVQHALKALSASTASDQELSVKNVSVAVVGEGHDFKELNDAALQAQLG
eukprot:GDKI01027894.1.p2 GENE.GDKI01027894.1~~GDKI01027894.1.p2  ORF type:complete len:235 (+),score=89.63 GDKI01027894.1:78-782(+)